MAFNTMTSKKKNVEEVSLETYQDDGEIFGDEGQQMEEAYSMNQVEFIRRGLTNRQRTVLELVLSGYSRKEIAKELGICLQAVNQIIPRIRKRITAMPFVERGLIKRFHDYN